MDVLLTGTSRNNQGSKYNLDRFLLKHPVGLQNIIETKGYGYVDNDTADLVVDVEKGRK